MYLNFVKSELKKWGRDSLMQFMLVYPIILGLIGRYLLPQIAKTSGFVIEYYADLILAILILFTPHIFGAIIGFSILDDRDDRIFTSIKVTPLSIDNFLLFKIITVFILSFAACAFVIWFSDIWALTVVQITVLGFLAALGSPVSGLLINVLAENKIEGFAIMKGTGIILVFPIVALFFIDIKELFFAFAPGFWVAKALSSIIRGEGILFLSFNQYYFIGIVYLSLLNILLYRAFINKTKSD